MKDECAGEMGGFFDVESPSGFSVVRDIGTASAGSGVEGAFGAVRGMGEVSEFAFDLFARAVAGVDDAEVFEPF